jgi:hypothetical protein
MARGWQPGTGKWVTVYGYSREEVKAKLLAQPYPVENPQYYGPVEGGIKE